jgi:mRNA-binding protein PUF3
MLTVVVRSIWARCTPLRVALTCNSAQGSGPDDSYLQPVASSSFEGKQGSSSLLPGSGEHDTCTWSSKPSAVGWAGDAVSPGLSTVGISPELARSPIRVRNNVKYDSPQQSTEVPRSSSPFYPMARQGTVGQVTSMSQSPNSKPYLDPSSASFGDTLEFPNNARGRSSEMSQFGGQRFSATGPADPGGRHLSSVLAGAMDGEDPNHLRRGRGLSNSRGVVPGADLLGTSVSSAGRSESLPPQQRANSTPPTYNPDQSPPNGGGFSSYTHVPTSIGGPQNAGLPAQGHGYPHGRYTDLSRETREAEIIAQFKQVSVEDENEPYPGRPRPPYPLIFSHPSNKFWHRELFVTVTVQRIPILSSGCACFAWVISVESG